MLLALGVVAALYEARRSGRGQVVDAAMVDGVAQLTALFHGGLAGGWWVPERESNLLDGAAPFYDTYSPRTANRLRSVLSSRSSSPCSSSGSASIPRRCPPSTTRDGWPELRRRLAEVISTRTEPSGPPNWRAPTPAPPGCSRWPRRPSIRTTWLGGPSSRSTGWSNPPRHPGSLPHRPGCLHRRPHLARTPMPYWPSSDSPGDEIGNLRRSGAAG